MKIKLLLIGTVLLSYVGTGFSQGNPRMNLVPASGLGLKQSTTISNPSESRTLVCSDTIRYPQVKEQILGSETFYYGFEVWEADDESVSQTFLNSSSIQITGVEFFGARSTNVNSASSVTVQASIYNVNASNIPTTLLGSGTVSFSTTSHGYRYVTFANPITVSGNYAVVLTPTNANGIVDLYINDETGGQSYDELFAHFYSSYTGYPNPNNWNTIPVFTGGYNFEPLVAPIVSYTINTTGTVAPLTACLGDEITFTNTTVFPQKTNRMLNYQAFKQYFGLTTVDSTYVWDLDWETNPASPGDLVWSENTTYTYAAAGTYEPALLTLGGFWSGCTDYTTFNVTINAIDDASFSYASSTICEGSANVTPASVTTPGGTFTSTTGLIFADASTGEIDIAGSTLGTYVVTYTTDGSCPDESTQTITITNATDATFTYASPTICEGSVNVTPTSVTTPGGTFTSTAGLIFADASTGEINVAGSTAGTYVVTYTTGGSCSDESTQTITITSTQDASFNYASSTICEGSANVTPASVTTPGGTFTSTTGLIFADASTGEIDIAGSTSGTYVVTYTTAGTCPDESTQTITITNAPDATFTYAAADYCTTGTNPSPTVTGTIGAFSATPAGLVISSSTGVITLATSTPGTYDVTNTIAASGSCPASSETVQVTITEAGDASFTYAASTYCLSGANPTPAITGTAGTFSSTTGLSVDAVTGEIDLTNSTPGTYTVTNELLASGACPVISATTQITITASPDASFTYAETAYCSTGTASPVVTGTAGTFTATPSGLSINGSTGVIDLANSTAGTYTVTNTIAATAACAEETETFTVTIEALPAATVSLSGITLTAQETGVTYQWINCAGNTPVAGETSQTFTPSVPGSYAVIVTSGNCSATSACQAVSNVGLEDNSIEVVAVYPNPAEHIITISGLTASNATVSVLDVNGRVLISEVTSSAKVELSVRDFEAGIYLIKVESETINGTKRFIKK